MAYKRAMAPNAPLAGTKPLIPTREAVYKLVANKRLPATKAATKCPFQGHLVEQRFEFDTANRSPQAPARVAALRLATDNYRQERPPPLNATYIAKVALSPT